MFTLVLAGICAAAWLYLLAARGRFWAARSRSDGNGQPQPGRWPAVAVVIPARNEADVISASLSLAAHAGLSRLAGHRGRGRRQRRRHGGGRGKGRGNASRPRRDHRHQPRRAGRLDRQNVGAEAGHRHRRVPLPARLFAADRCRHRARARHARLADGASRGRQLCAHLADGEAQLREPGRAQPCAGLHLFLPDAFPLRLGAPAGLRDRGRRRRLHAGARRCAARRRRHRRHPPCADRRLRAGARS